MVTRYEYDTGILAEKLTQAKLYAESLGGGRMRDGYIEVERSPLGHAVIIWGWGHVGRLEEPRDENERFRDWRGDHWPHVNRRPRLLPSEDAKCRAQVAVARRLLPKCRDIIGATDPDREGETIWPEFLELAGQLGRRNGVRRMLCSEMNVGPVKAAFANLQDQARLYGRYRAGVTRSLIDMWDGTNATVACTSFLRPSSLGKGFWPMGRVKGAVLWILWQRERELRDFRPVTYYELVASVAIGGGTLTLRHAPPPEKRLLDQAAVLRLAEGARGSSGPLKVEQKAVETAAPKLFNKTGFITRAGALWGWSGKKSAEILQTLYQDHGLITYPRGDLDKISSTDVEQAPEILANLRALGEPFASAIDALGGRLTVRKGPVVNDRAVAEASHTAIIPTLKPPAGVSLTADEAKAYRLIAQRYVAALSPNAQGQRTTVTLVPTGGAAAGLAFSAGGTVETDPGWRRVYGGAEDEDEEREDRLPAVRNGETGRIDGCRCDAKTTKPPPRYTETSILEAMVEVHKLIPDEDVQLKEVLKSSKGVGTAATRETVVAELINAGLAARLPVKGKGAPPLQLAEQGGMLVDSLVAIDPDIVHAKSTALLEIELDRIEKARDAASADRLAQHLLDEAEDRIRRQFEAIRARAVPREDGGARPAGPGQLAFVRRIAETLDLDVEERRITAMSVREASAFIDEHKEAFEAAAPPRGGRSGDRSGRSGERGSGRGVSGRGSGRSGSGRGGSGDDGRRSSARGGRRSGSSGSPRRPAH